MPGAGTSLSHTPGSCEGDLAERERGPRGRRHFARWRAKGRRPSGTVARAPRRSLRVHLVAGHGVSRQEPRHPSSDGLGPLDLQEMADPLDCELLDLRE